MVVTNLDYIILRLLDLDTTKSLLRANLSVPLPGPVIAAHLGRALKENFPSLQFDQGAILPAIDRLKNHTDSGITKNSDGTYLIQSVETKRHSEPTATQHQANTATALDEDFVRAADLLKMYFSSSELQTLLGKDFVVGLKKYRARKGSRITEIPSHDLALAIVLRHQYDLFCCKEIRAALAKKTSLKSPGRWHSGKQSAREFVFNSGFPLAFAGAVGQEVEQDFELFQPPHPLPALADFQVEVKQKINALLSGTDDRAIMSLPTGGGKTRTTTEAIRDWLTWESKKGRSPVVVWLAHTDELCSQAAECVKEIWTDGRPSCPTAMVRLWADYSRSLESQVESMSVGTSTAAIIVSTPVRFRNLLSGVFSESELASYVLRRIKLLVIDEAHRSAAPSYREILDILGKANTGAKVLGLTATPFRASYASDLNPTKELAELFRNNLITPAKTLGNNPKQTLIERSILSVPIFKSIEIRNDGQLPPELVRAATARPEDTDELTQTNIDIQVCKLVDKPNRRTQLLEQVSEVAKNPDASVIYFGPSVADAELMAFLLRENGVPAGFVSASTRQTARRQLIEDFRLGKIRVLCNCEVLTTGFDAPKITHIFMARPTVSHVLYEQMIGRGLRGPKFGGTKTCEIINCVDIFRNGRLPTTSFEEFKKFYDYFDELEDFRKTVA